MSRCRGRWPTRNGYSCATATITLPELGGCWRRSRLISNGVTSTPGRPVGPAGGSDLREGDGWLDQREGHGKAPTREQGEYIARSRQAASRRLYALIGSLAAGLVVATVLAIFALIQRQTAISETPVAQSRQLASQSTSTSDLQLASLMALESYRLSPTLDAQSAILGVADNHEIAP